MSSTLLSNRDLKVNNPDDKNNPGIGDESTKELHKYIAKDEYNKLVASSNSMNGLSSLLGISLQGLKYHLNR